jgi:hypothetical protein
MVTPFGALSGRELRRGMHVQRGTPSSSQSGQNITLQKSARQNMPRQIFALFNHIVRFIKESVAEGLSTHGECHHGFPAHPQRGETPDDP